MKYYYGATLMMKLGISEKHWKQDMMFFDLTTNFVDDLAQKLHIKKDDYMLCFCGLDDKIVLSIDSVFPSRFGREILANSINELLLKPRYADIKALCLNKMKTSTEIENENGMAK